MAVVVDELIIRLIADGVEKAKKELLDAAKAAADAQKKLTNTEEQEAAKQAKIQEQKAKKAEAEAKKAARAVEQAQKKASAAARQGTQEFFGALEKMNGMFSRVAATVAVGLTAAFGGAAAAVKSLTSDADQIKTMANYTGLTTTRFQELGYAAEVSGLSTEKLADGFKEFANNLRESAVSGGKGSAADSIRQLGLNFKEIVRLSPDQQLLKIADAAKEMGPSLGRTAALSRLFGEEAGAKIGRLMDRGSEGIEQLAAEAHKLGYVIESDTLGAAVDLQLQWERTLAAGRGLRNTVAAELIPVLGDYLKDATAWIASNRELIGVKVREWLGEIVAIGKQFIPWLKTALSLTIDLVKATKDWIPALTATAVAIKGILVAKEVVTVLKGLGGAFTIATSGATGFAAAIGPGGAVMAAALAFLPIALEIGDALGDIGSFESKSRKSIQQKLAISPVNAVTGSFAGESILAQELAELSPAERKALKQETSSRSRAARAAGSTTSPEEKQQILAMFKVLEEADYISSKREQKANSEQEQKRLAENIGRLSNRELKSLLSSGQITQEQFDLERGRRNSSSFFAKRPEEKDKVTDEELAKLIASATKSGANLDELLKGRKIAGGTPPVITLRLFEFRINAPITVNGQPGQSTTQLATAVADEFTNRLERELQKHTPSILEAR